MIIFISILFLSSIGYGFSLPIFVDSFFNTYFGNLFLEGLSSYSSYIKYIATLVHNLPDFITYVYKLTHDSSLLINQQYNGYYIYLQSKTNICFTIVSIFCFAIVNIISGTIIKNIYFKALYLSCVKINEIFASRFLELKTIFHLKTFLTISIVMLWNIKPSLYLLTKNI